MKFPLSKKSADRRAQTEGRIVIKALVLIACLLVTPFGLEFLLRAATSTQVELPATGADGKAILKMVQPRWGHSATLLPDGRVLVTGGETLSPEGGIVPASIPEVFDPFDQTFTALSASELEALQVQALGPVAAEVGAMTLSTGARFLFGLEEASLSGLTLDTSWDQNVGSLRRSMATATMLDGAFVDAEGRTAVATFDRRVVLIGGLDASGLVLDAAVFNPARLETDKDDYAPGEDVSLYGTGWKPNEEVDIYVVDDQGWTLSVMAVADADGAFAFAAPRELFEVQWIHANVTFNLKAVGLGSGLVASVVFTDSVSGSKGVNINAPTLASPVSIPGTAGTSLEVHYTPTFDLATPGGAGYAGATVVSTIVTAELTPTGGGGIPVNLLGQDTLGNPAGVSGVARTFTFTLPSDLPPGNGYNLKLTITQTYSAGAADSSADNENNAVKIMAPPAGSGSLVVDAQAGTATYGGVEDTVTFLVDATRTTSGTFDGTYSVSGLPAGASGTFSPATFNTSGTTPFPDPTLTVLVPATVPAGSYTFTVTCTPSNTGAAAFSNTGTLIVGRKNVSGTFVALDKVYDGNVSATVSSTTVVGREGSDSVTLTGGTATFSDKNVGVGKTVTLIGATLSGPDAGNYSLTSVETTTADITGLPVTGSFTAANKVYDGTTTALVTGRTLGGLVGGDDVVLTGGTATFSDRNVGVGKTVTLTGATLSGPDAGNYSLASVETTTADITGLPVTGSFTASNKVYDGTTAALVTGRTLGGLVGGDDVVLTGGTATFSDKNVGVGKTVTLTGATLSGPEAGNYSLTSVATTTADITGLPVTGSFTAANKVYDGTTAALVTGRTLGGLVGGDDVVLTGGTAMFSDKNVGVGKTVTLSGATLSGPDAGNYSLTSVETTTADITGLPVTGSFTAANKVYDGTTTALVTGRTLGGLVGGDDVVLTGGTATFSDKNVGVGKIVTLTGATLSGPDAGNYSLTSVETTTADITGLPVTGSFTAANKVYDGTTAALVTGRSLTGVLSGDTVTLTGGTATFSDKNVGVGKTVTLTGATLSGPDAGNYSLTSVETTTADITGLPVTGSFTAANKVYDGTTTALVTGRTLGGLVGGDDVVLTGGTATFSDKNVGVGKTVTLTGATLSGPDAGNYSLTSVETTTADITVQSLTISAVTSTKVYDKTTSSVGVPTVSGLQGTDTVTGLVQVFDSVNVGPHTLSVTTYLVNDGNAGGNYTVSLTTATGTITVRPLTISAVTSTKVYDKTTTSAGIPTVSGLQGTDTVTGLMQVFDSVNAGPRILSVSAYTVNDGNNGGNYAVTTNTALGSITRAPLLISAVSANKTYDGTTNSPGVPTVTGLISPDTVTGLVQAYDSPNVGIRTLRVTAYTVNDGNNGGNYAVTTNTATGEIGSRDALLRYIGQTYAVTSGSSQTTAQVQLAASIQDPTQVPIVGALVRFVDVETGKVLADNVPVARVAGTPDTGTAAAWVTLSTGQYGAQSYTIRVEGIGNYNNDDQVDVEKTCVVSVVIPTPSSSIIGGGTLKHDSTAAGTYRGTTANKAFSVALRYTKSGSNSKGQAYVILPQEDGSMVEIKMTSITSMTVSGTGPITGVATAKGTAFRIKNGVVTTIDGNLQINLVITDLSATNGSPGSTIAFQALSSKDGSMLYSTSWKLVTTTSNGVTSSRWQTVGVPVVTGVLDAGL